MFRSRAAIEPVLQRTKSCVRTDEGLVPRPRVSSDIGRGDFRSARVVGLSLSLSFLPLRAGPGARSRRDVVPRRALRRTTRELRRVTPCFCYLPHNCHSPSAPHLARPRDTLLPQGAAGRGGAGCHARGSLLRHARTAMSRVSRHATP